MNNFAVSRKIHTFALAFRNLIVGKDPLAQLVEHNTFNVGVLGSSPKRITERKPKTTKTADNQVLSAFFFYPRTAFYGKMGQ